MTNKEATALLRDLAQDIEAGGRVEVATRGWSLGVNPLSPINI